MAPLFDAHEIPLLRMLTDRGTEYCGNLKRHEYALYLAVGYIEHNCYLKPKVHLTFVVERFHKTLLDEFYRVVFRKKVYQSIDELQADLDDWSEGYNAQRPHQGPRYKGQNTDADLLDSLSLVRKKSIAA